MRLPFERAVRVTLHMSSGAEVRFTCSNVTCGVDRQNRLAEVKVENSVGFPLYVRLEDVVAVTTKFTFRNKP